MTLFNTPVLYEHCLLVCVPLWQHSETVRTYSEMSSLLLLFAFQQLKITCFKPQCLKMCANNTFSWPCSTATSHDRVTMIETIVKNLYWLTNFYRLFLSTDISHTPTKNEKSFFFLPVSRLGMFVFFNENKSPIITNCHCNQLQF